MALETIILTGGAFAAAISTIAGLVFATFKMMFASHVRESDLAKVKADAAIANDLGALDKRLTNTESNIANLSNVHHLHGEKLEDTVRRIIKIESSQENIEKTLIKLETKLDNHNETVIALLQKMNK